MSIKDIDISKSIAKELMKKWDDRLDTIQWLQDNYKQIGYDETASELELIRPFIRDFLNDLLDIVEGGHC